MRGVYTSSQQKILIASPVMSSILEPSRAANPDFSTGPRQEGALFFPPKIAALQAENV
jgi:hypothetical protein